MMQKYARMLPLACAILSVGLILCAVQIVHAAAPPAPNPQSGSLGIEAKLGGAPPSQAPTITVPSNGQRFSNQPITVSGLCTTGLLVEVFDNGVFVGSVQCVNGSFSLQISLFDGRNDLIARVYDALNQASPNSNKVTVFFSSALPSSGSRPTLTTAYAKRGADPGSVLTWPIALSGGKGPYAISVDWGDNSVVDLISRETPGTFNIKHTYAQSGIFNIVIKVTDSNGASAFLQLVGISNGPIQQTLDTNNPGATTIIKKEVIWWPLIVMFVLTVVTFWLGKRHQLQTIRSRLHRGERPI